MPLKYSFPIKKNGHIRFTPRPHVLQPWSETQQGDVVEVGLAHDWPKKPNTIQELVTMEIE